MKLTIPFWPSRFFYVTKKLKQKFVRTKRAFNVKKKAFFIVFKDLSLKEIKQIFLEGKSPTLTQVIWLQEDRCTISFEKSIFPDDWKIVKFTPVFKSDDNTELSNYRPISILYDRVMYNRLYKYLLNSNILYKKQFDFQEGHSTDHAILQLVDQIHNNFEQTALL